MPQLELLCTNYKSISYRFTPNIRQIHRWGCYIIFTAAIRCRQRTSYSWCKVSFYCILLMNLIILISYNPKLNWMISSSLECLNFLFMNNFSPLVHNLSSAYSEVLHKNYLLPFLRAYYHRMGGHMVTSRHSHSPQWVHSLQCHLCRCIVRNSVRFLRPAIVRRCAADLVTSLSPSNVDLSMNEQPRVCIIYLNRICFASLARWKFINLIINSSWPSVRAVIKLGWDWLGFHFSAFTFAFRHAVSS